MSASITFYKKIASPLGDIHVTGSKDAIETLYFVAPEQVDTLHAIKDMAAKDVAVFSQLEQELNAYFEGKLEHFTTPMQSHGTDFQMTVWQALQTLAFGETTSYADIAEQIGKASATRAVANAIGKNPLSILVPCHRVIGSDGKLRGYAGGVERKKWLLEHEASSL